jgi:hypothetical protein
MSLPVFNCRSGQGRWEKAESEWLPSDDEDLQKYFLNDPSPFHLHDSDQSTTSKFWKLFADFQIKTMACLCCCVPDDEVEGDKFGDYRNLFKVSLQDAPCADPGCCAISCLCCPCAVYSSRVNALDGDMKQYSCCQVHCEKK